MADANANIRIGVDTSDALAQIKNLQRQISLFHSSMANSGKAAADQSARMQSNLVNSINATRGFSAQMTTVKSSTEAFTNALEKNKLSLGQTMRFAGASTKTFGKLFKSEFNTINKVARERVKDLQTQYIKMGRDANGAMQAIKIRPTTLDMQNFGTQTAMAAQRTQLLNQLLKQGSTNLLNWGKNTQWAGRQLMVGFTIPLTIFGSLAARTFMQLEEQAIRFKRVYGDMFTSDKEVDEALAGVKELAEEFTKFGVAVEDTIDLAASVAQMGAVGEDLKNQVTEATRLSVLGGIEQQEALDTTISLTNAFGLATDELSGKVAFLNAVENQTILSIEDFNEAIPKAGSVVRQLGGDVEDLAFFLTAMREGGINASQSANALKSSLARLINPTEVAVEKMSGFGIDILGIVDDNAGNLKETIQVLAVELDKLDPLDKARAIEQLFGKFQFARMSTLFENIVKEGSQANKVLDITTNSTEELAIIAERELGKVAESPMFKFKKAFEELQVALAPIGKAFLELATPVLDFAKGVLDQFNNLSDGAKKFIVGLTAIAGVVAPAVLMVVGLIANAIANTMKLGLVIRNAFGKAGQSSNFLTDQFEYMNQEQIEGAAIAASLDQAHAKLRQTFTSESAAVDKLTAAYTRAIAKQNQMMMSGPGAGARGAGRARGFNSGTSSVPGYNQGVVSVPGSGNKDTVPAMLTPGEAVIPKEMAKKYGPLIDAMFANSIPGYNRGRNPYQRSHITGQLDPNEPNILSQLQAMYPGTSAAQFQNFEVLSDLTMDLPEWMNQDLREKSGGIDPDQFQFSSKQTQNKLLATSQSAATDMGLELGDEYLSGLSQGFEDEITDRASDLARQRGVNVTDPILSEAREEVLETARRQGGDRGVLAEGLQRKARTVGSTRAALGGQEDVKLRKMLERGEAKVVRGSGGGLSVFSSNKDGTTGPKLGRFSGGSSDPELQKWFNEGADPKKLPERFRIRGSSSTPKAGTYETRRRMATTTAGIPSSAKEQRAQAQKDFNDQAAKSAKTSSESKRTKKIAKDTVDGYANELERGKKKVKQTAKEKAKLEEQSRARLYGGATPSTQEKAARRQAEKRAKREAAEQKRVAKLRREQNLRMYGTENVTPEMRQERKRQESLEKQRRKVLKQQQQNNQAQTKVVQAEQVNAKKLSVVGRLRERMLRRKQARLNREQALMAQEGNMQAGGRGARRRGMGAGGMAGVGMAASSAVMMASMAPGKVGETAQKLMMPMMGLSMILPMLTSKVGAAVVVFGLLVAGLMWVNSSFNKLQKEAMELTESLGGGSKAMKDFAKAAGTASAGEIMDKRRENAFGVFQIQPGKNTFGSGFMGSDEGKQFREGVQTSLGTQGAQATQQQVTNQLATAVASGALTTEQARSIVGELARELQDYSFGIAVNAELTQLLGPNGENLAEDPLGIRLQILDESQARLDQSFENLGETANRTINDNLMQGGGIIAGGLAGALGGAAIGGAIGTVVPVIGNAIGAAVGGVVGGIGGAIAGGVIGGKQRNDRIATASGASVAMQKIAIQQQQEMMDSLELEYEQRIENARAAGDLAKVEELTNQRIEDRSRLLEENQELIQGIQTNYAEAEGDIQDALMSGADKAIASKYEDTALADVAPEAISQVEGSVQDEEVQYLLKMQMASGEIDPLQMINFLNAFEQGSAEQTAIVNLIGSMGGAFTNQTMGLLSLFVDEDGNPVEDIQSDILLNIESAGSPEEADALLQFYQQLSQTDVVLDREAKFRFILENPEEADKLQAQLAEIDSFSGEVTMDVVANIAGQEAVDALNKDMEYWSTLDDTQKKIYLQTLVTTIATVSPDDPALQNWLGAEGSNWANSPPGEQVAAYANYNAEIVTKIAQDTTEAAAPTEDLGGGGGGGGPKKSVLDDLLKKLRDIRKSQIEVTKGWAASREKLDELFGEGKNIKIFGGIEQQMRSLGLGQDLIKVIVGMDPDEYERRKDELFQFDDAGNIVGVTTALGNMGRALRAVALGEFQNEQERVLSGLNDQFVAMRKLTAAGMSTAAAYEAVKDSAFAAAVAREKDNDVIRETIKLYEKAEERTRAFQAAQALANKNQETQDLRGTVKFIEQNARSLSEAQKSAIMDDPDLQTLIMDPRVDPKTLTRALENAEKQADLDLRVKKLTFEGLTDIFNEGFNKAMEAFSVQEKEIELDFAVKKEPFLEAIKEAEEDISDIRNKAGGLDDLQADLERISWQEEQINKSYDQRVDALDKVKTINDDLAQQQQSQLDVAEALSRGDIAAAARAAQELRKQKAESAAKKQEDQLEISREKALAALVGNMGKTRKELEEEIKQLNKEIFNIEEQRIEPAQRQIELLTRTQEELVDGLTVLGKTREEWERLKNRVDLARISSEQFIKSMQDALDVVKDIVDYWDNFPTEKHIKIFQDVQPYGEEEEEQEELPAPPPRPDPGTGGGGTERERAETDRAPDESIINGRVVGPSGSPVSEGIMQRDALGPGHPDHPDYNHFSRMDKLFRDYGSSERTGQNQSFDVLGGVPEGYYQKPGTDPGPLGDPALALTEYEKGLLGQARSSETNTTGSGGGAGPRGPIGSPGAQGVGNIRATTSVAPVPTALRGASAGPAGSGDVSSAIAGVNRVEGQIASLGQKTPTLLQPFNDFYSRAPETTRPPLEEGVAGNISSVGNRAPLLMAGFSGFFGAPLRTAAKEGIETGVAEPLQNTSDRAPSLMSRILGFFKGDVPKATDETFNRKLPDHLTGLANKAPGKLSPIQGFFDKLPGKAGPKIENDLASSFLRLAVLAPVVLQSISTWFQELPFMPSVRGAIIIGIPSMFNQAADLSITMLKVIENYFRMLPLKVRQLIQPISTMFYLEGKESAERFIKEVNRQFNNFKPVLEITRKIITIYEVQESNRGGLIHGYNMGGSVSGFNKGGGYQNLPMSGRVPGSGSYDKVKTLLTPGEFVIRKEAVAKYGEGLMQMINSAKLSPESFSAPTFDTSSKSYSSPSTETKQGEVMYNNNYAINVNVKSDANPDQIARTVMQNIKKVDSQRIRSNRL